MPQKTLKSSAEKIGCLYPILLDNNGEIIDGEHRFQADKNWRKVKLTQIKTEKDKLVVRIVANNVRRRVTSAEKNQILNQLGQVLMNEGVEPGRIVSAIAEETGMSYRWVAKYLASDFKDTLQSGRAKSAAQHTAKLLGGLSVVKNAESAIIKTYVNTNFVTVTLQKHFYMDFQRTSSELGIPPEISVQKALEQYHAKMKQALKLKQTTIFA